MVTTHGSAVSETLLTIAVLVFILAGLVKGVIGMGLPTVAIALLGALMTPAQAASLMVIPSLLTNVWQGVIGTHTAALLRRLGTMLAGICVGTAAAVSGMGGLQDARTASAVLGLALMTYAAYGLLVRPLSVPAGTERWLTPIVGVVTGAVSGMTGVFVMPSVPYLQAIGLPKDELVQALGITFTVATVALAVALIQTGHFDMPTASRSAFFLVPALIGMLMGQMIRQRVSVKMFRICFFVGTFVLGAHLVLKRAL